jgi:hypothetical protein
MQEVRGRLLVTLSGLLTRVGCDQNALTAKTEQDSAPAKAE